MPFFLFIWSEEIEEHLSLHGVTPDEFEAIRRRWTEAARLAVQLRSAR
jgi:hypothetical protein